MTPTLLWAFLIGLLWKGIMGMFMSLLLLHPFLLGGDVYCLYLYYPYGISNTRLPIPVGSKCFLLIYATGNLKYLDPSNPSIENAYIANPNLVFPGWLLISAIALVITWPLAYAIRSPSLGSRKFSNNGCVVLS